MFPTDELQKKIFLCLLAVVACAIGALEALIPMGIAPGVKLGMANVVTLMVLYLYGLREGLFITLFRVAVTYLLFGNATSLLFSACGGVLSALTMGLLARKAWISPVGVSLSGSFAHISGQILCAYLLFRSPAVFYYYPFVLLLSIITGGINGIIGLAALKKLKRN